MEYGKYADSDSSIIVPWNSSITKSDFITTVLQAKQWTNKPSSIYRAFQELSLIVLSDHTLHFSSIIFVTDTSNDYEINKSVETFEKFLKLKVFLTLIAAGENANLNKLTAFKARIFDWRDLAKPYPIGWNIEAAQGCVKNISSTTSSPTKSSSISSTTATTTTTLQSYMPCKGFFTVLSDTSDVLSVNQFQKQIHFINLILSQVSHVERIQYGSYCSANALITFSWNSENTESTLQKSINATIQIQSAMARLGNAMQALVQSMGKSETAIIFITDTSSEFDINKALGLYNAILKNHTKLTFILAGEKAKAENLAEFNATIFDWKNMDLEKPNNWNAFKAFGC